MIVIIKKGENVNHAGFDDAKKKIVGVGKIGMNPSTSTENVLLIDSLKHNLLSIYQLCEKAFWYHLILIYSNK